MHSGSLESTQEARVALGYRLVQILRIFRALQTSRVHPEFDIRTLSMKKFLSKKPISQECKAIWEFLKLASNAGNI